MPPKRNRSDSPPPSDDDTISDEYVPDDDEESTNEEISSSENSSSNSPPEQQNTKDKTKSNPQSNNDEDDEGSYDEEIEDFDPDDKDKESPSKQPQSNTIIILPLELLLRQLNQEILDRAESSEDEDFVPSGNDEDTSSSDNGEHPKYRNPDCQVDGPCPVCEAEGQKRAGQRKRGRDETDESPISVVQKKKKIKKTKVDIDEKIESLDDLIEIIDKYEEKPTLDYSINMKYLKALKEPLIELKNMVGLDEIKTQILDQIMYLLSHLQDSDQMLHTAIYGAPGAGKSSLGVILSKIYRALGYSNGKFKIVKASDLIAGYVGQTAIKTQKVIDEAKGGVLFIDEAYSLGSRNDFDGFSKEAIDCINQNLTERRAEFICIIAGYKQQLEECFFAYNPGLNRRFPFRYEIKEYKLPALFEIFHRRISISGWTMDKIPLKLFEKHEEYLTEKGGDMETISQMAKLAYSRRTFGKHQEPPKHLTLADVEEGFKNFLKSDEVRNRPKKMDHDKFFETHIRPTMFT